MKNIKNKGIKNIFGVSLLLFLFVGVVSFRTNTKDIDKTNATVTEWVAPASADNIKNPVKPSEQSLKDGKKLYKTYCTACHGVKGKGDGLAAASLKPKPADFTSEKAQGQTDGAIYWKLTEGRSPMAGYKATLTDTQRWNLVNYIRTLKK